jgi:hypothetical protein
MGLRLKPSVGPRASRYQAAPSRLGMVGISNHSRRDAIRSSNALKRPVSACIKGESGVR